MSRTCLLNIWNKWIFFYGILRLVFISEFCFSLLSHYNRAATKKKKIRFYLLPVPLCQICFVFGFDLTKSQSSKSISNGYGPICHRIFKRLKCLNILSSLPHETRASETRNKLSAFSDKKGDVPFWPQLNDHSEYSFGTFT